LPQENPDRRPAARSRSIARTLSPATLDRVQQHIGDTFEAVSQLLNEAQGSEQEDQIISVWLLISQAEQRLTRGHQARRDETEVEGDDPD
jgi:hypothetical protein